MSAKEIFLPNRKIISLRHVYLLAFLTGTGVPDSWV